jgi:hypothetical protein
MSRAEAVGARVACLEEPRDLLPTAIWASDPSRQLPERIVSTAFSAAC